MVHVYVAMQRVDDVMRRSKVPTLPMQNDERPPAGAANKADRIAHDNGSGIMKKIIQLTVLASMLAVCAASAMAAITYEYDGLHRLTKVTYDDGTAVLFEYDAVGNRTMRVMSGDPNYVYLSTDVEPPGSGSVIRNPDQTWYAAGEPVELTAAGSGLCELVEWTGDVPVGHEYDNPLTVTAAPYLMFITAHFASPLGDADCDCDLDLDDFAGFQRCFGQTPVSDECAVFDFDESNTIDLTDFDQFGQAFTGPSE